MPIHLQVCFVLDIHKTMNNFMGSIKDQIQDILNEVSSKYPTIAIHVAFVGYSGYFAVPYDKVNNFTDDVKLLQRDLNNLKIQHSWTSSCRSIQHAYGHVNDLKWVGSRKIIFHMGNAPAFGPKYHAKNIQDLFPLGHPYLVLEEEVEKFSIKKIDLVLLKLDNKWNQMLEVIKDSYLYYRGDGLYVEDLTMNHNDLRSHVKSVVIKHILRKIM